MPRLGIGLHDILLEKGLVTEQAVVRALDHQLLYGGRLGTNLVELGYVRLDDLGRMLAMQWEVGFGADPESGLAQSARQLIDPKVCIQNQAIPLKIEGNRLHLAMAEPSAENVVSLASTLGYKIIPYIVPELRLLFWFEQFYHLRRPGRFLRFPEPGPTVYQRRHYLRPTVDLADPGAGYAGGEIMVFAPVEEGAAGGQWSPGSPELLALARQISINARSGLPETDDELEIDTSSFDDLGGGGLSRVPQARKQVERSTSSALIEQILVGPLLSQAETRILFWVRGEFAVACCAGGSIRNMALVPNLVLRWQQSPLMDRALHQADVIWGRSEADALLNLIADYLGAPPPGEHCVVPVLLGGRAIYLLCIQTRRGTRFPMTALSQLRRLSGATTLAYQRLRSGLTCWPRRRKGQSKMP